MPGFFQFCQPTPAGKLGEFPRVCGETRHGNFRNFRVKKNQAKKNKHDQGIQPYRAPLDASLVQTFADKRNAVLCYKKLCNTMLCCNMPIRNAMVCNAVLCHTTPCYVIVMACYSRLCNAMQCHAMPCKAMQGHAIPCYVM